VRANYVINANDTHTRNRRRKPVHTQYQFLARLTCSLVYRVFLISVFGNEYDSAPLSCRLMYRFLGFRRRFLVCLSLVQQWPRSAISAHLPRDEVCWDSGNPDTDKVAVDIGVVWRCFRHSLQQESTECHGGADAGPVTRSWLEQKWSKLYKLNTQIASSYVTVGCEMFGLPLSWAAVFTTTLNETLRPYFISAAVI